MLLEAQKQGTLNKDSRIVCLPLFLSMGDISDLANLESRRDLYHSLYGEFDHTSIVKQAFVQLQKIEKTSAPIRIWYSNEPDELCGMLFISWMLRDWNVNICTIQCSRSIALPGHTTLYKNSTNLSLEDVPIFLSFSQELEQPLAAHFANLWECLAKKNSELRVTENGAVRSVSIDYFDKLILKSILQQPFQVSHLVADIMKQPLWNMNDFILFSRLRAMLEEGQLRLIERRKSFPFYILQLQ